MTKTVFINLPVTDLVTSTAFYEAIGCTRNEQFSDETTASSMVWSDTITFHLLTREHFADFINPSLEIPDAHKTCQVLFALTCDDRSAVDAMVEAGAANGGTADPRAVQDMGWLYNRALADPDGHTIEAVWADPDAAPGDAS